MHGQVDEVGLDIRAQPATDGRLSRQPRRHRLRRVGDHRLNDRAQQLVLAVEVVQQRRLADTDPRRDRSKRCPRVAGFGQLLDRSVDDSGCGGSVR